MSANMTNGLDSDTSAALVSMGRAIYRNTQVHIVGFAWYGVYLMTFLIYLVFTIAYPVHTRASYLLFGALLLLFLSTTFQFSLDLAYTMVLLKDLLIDTSFPLGMRKQHFDDLRGKIIYPLERWAPAINFMISDLIVVWRATVVNKHAEYKRWMRAVLYVLALADIGEISPTLVSLPGPNHSNSPVGWLFTAGITSRDALARSNNPHIDQDFNTMANFISLGTNLVSTAFIAKKAWRHKRVTKHMSIGGGDGSSRVTKALLLMVETGFVWAGVQFVFAVLQQVNRRFHSPIDTATGVFSKTATFLAAILPTATVIIVRAERSIEYIISSRSEMSGSRAVSGTGMSMPVELSTVVRVSRTTTVAKDGLGRPFRFTSDEEDGDGDLRRDQGDSDLENGNAYGQEVKGQL
ncbi:hypothetical protein MKEN_00023000 [Mycena kentingensis (nom. inval.)]|nr:hypothetical protein MKEN_00023000 [Mycena kentingensis (nom. inval.)]